MWGRTPSPAAFDLRLWSGKLIAPTTISTLRILIPTSKAVGGARPTHHLLHQAVVLLQYLAQAVVGQADDLKVVDALHRLGCDHGVHYGFLGGLNRGQEDGIQALVGKHGELAHTLRSGGAGVCG